MFSLAETFLLVWALGATAIAVYSRHKAKQLSAWFETSQAILVGMIEGTAAMKKESNGATFTNLYEGEVTDEIRIKVRQS
jgi:hypothetical protein